MNLAGWGTKITEKVLWHVVKEYAERLGLKNWRHTTLEGHALGCVMIQTANGNKSNFSSVMYLCRRRKNIWDANSDSDAPLWTDEDKGILQSRCCYKELLHFLSGGG